MPLMADDSVAAVVPLRELVTLAHVAYTNEFDSTLLGQKMSAARFVDGDGYDNPFRDWIREGRRLAGDAAADDDAADGEQHEQRQAATSPDAMPADHVADLTPTTRNHRAEKRTALKDIRERLPRFSSGTGATNKKTVAKQLRKFLVEELARLIKTKYLRTSEAFPAQPNGAGSASALAPVDLSEVWSTLEAVTVRWAFPHFVLAALWKAAVMAAGTDLATLIQQRYGGAAVIASSNLGGADEQQQTQRRTKARSPYLPDFRVWTNLAETVSHLKIALQGTDVVSSCLNWTSFADGFTSSSSRFLLDHLEDSSHLRLGVPSPLTISNASAAGVDFLANEMERQMACRLFSAVNSSQAVVSGNAAALSVAHAAAMLRHLRERYELRLGLSTPGTNVGRSVTFFGATPPPPAEDDGDEFSDRGLSSADGLDLRPPPPPLFTPKRLLALLSFPTQLLLPVSKNKSLPMNPHEKVSKTLEFAAFAIQDVDCVEKTVPTGAPRDGKVGDASRRFLSEMLCLLCSPNVADFAHDVVVGAAGCFAEGEQGCRVYLDLDDDEALAEVAEEPRPIVNRVSPAHALRAAWSDAKSRGTRGGGDTGEEDIQWAIFFLREFRKVRGRIEIEGGVACPARGRFSWDPFAYPAFVEKLLLAQVLPNLAQKNQRHCAAQMIANHLAVPEKVRNICALLLRRHGRPDAAQADGIGDEAPADGIIAGANLEDESASGGVMGSSLSLRQKAEDATFLQNFLEYLREKAATSFLDAQDSVEQQSALDVEELQRQIFGADKQHFALLGQELWRGLHIASNCSETGCAAAPSTSCPATSPSEPEPDEAARLDISEHGHEDELELPTEGVVAAGDAEERNFLPGAGSANANQEGALNSSLGSSSSSSRSPDRPRRRAVSTSSSDEDTAEQPVLDPGSISFADLAQSPRSGAVAATETEASGSAAAARDAHTATAAELSMASSSSPSDDGPRRRRYSTPSSSSGASDASSGCIDESEYGSDDLRDIDRNRRAAAAEWTFPDNSISINFDSCRVQDQPGAGELRGGQEEQASRCRASSQYESEDAASCAERDDALADYNFSRPLLLSLPPSDEDAACWGISTAPNAERTHSEFQCARRWEPNSFYVPNVVISTTFADHATRASSGRQSLLDESSVGDSAAAADGSRSCQPEPPRSCVTCHYCASSVELDKVATEMLESEERVLAEGGISIASVFMLPQLVFELSKPRVWDLVSPHVEPLVGTICVRMGTRILFFDVEALQWTLQKSREPDETANEVISQCARRLRKLLADGHASRLTLFFGFDAKQWLLLKSFLALGGNGRNRSSGLDSGSFGGNNDAMKMIIRNFVDVQAVVQRLLAPPNDENPAQAAGPSARLGDVVRNFGLRDFPLDEHGRFSLGRSHQRGAHSTSPASQLQPPAPPFVHYCAERCYILEAVLCTCLRMERLCSAAPAPPSDPTTTPQYENGKRNLLADCMHDLNLSTCYDGLLNKRGKYSSRKRPKSVSKPWEQTASSSTNAAKACAQLASLAAPLDEIGGNFNYPYRGINTLEEWKEFCCDLEGRIVDQVASCDDLAEIFRKDAQARANKLAAQTGHAPTTVAANENSPSSSTSCGASDQQTEGTETVAITGVEKIANGGSGTLSIERCRAELVAHVDANSVSCVLGATGSGKSTKLPQYLYDERVQFREIEVPAPSGGAGVGASYQQQHQTTRAKKTVHPSRKSDFYCLVVQPRRHAAEALAGEVRRQMLEKYATSDKKIHEKVVGYRFGNKDDFSRSRTSILFTTYGFFLEEVVGVLPTLLPKCNSWPSGGGAEESENEDTQHASAFFSMMAEDNPAADGETTSDEDGSDAEGITISRTTNSEELSVSGMHHLRQDSDESEQRDPSAPRPRTRSANNLTREKLKQIVPYTHIILDEMHEHSIESGLVLYALQQIFPILVYLDVKIVMMSATMEPGCLLSFLVSSGRVQKDLVSRYNAAAGLQEFLKLAREKYGPDEQESEMSLLLRGADGQEEYVAGSNEAEMGAEADARANDAQDEFVARLPSIPEHQVGECDDIAAGAAPSGPPEEDEQASFLTANTSVDASSLGLEVEVPSQAGEILLGSASGQQDYEYDKPETMPVGLIRALRNCGDRANLARLVFHIPGERPYPVETMYLDDEVLTDLFPGLLYPREKDKGQGSEDDWGPTVCSLNGLYTKSAREVEAAVAAQAGGEADDLEIDELLASTRLGLGVGGAAAASGLAGLSGQGSLAWLPPCDEERNAEGACALPLDEDAVMENGGGGQSPPPGESSFLGRGGSIEDSVNSSLYRHSVVRAQAWVKQLQVVCQDLLPQVLEELIRENILGAVEKQEHSNILVLLPGVPTIIDLEERLQRPLGKTSGSSRSGGASGGGRQNRTSILEFHGYKVIRLAREILDAEEFVSGGQHSKSSSTSSHGALPGCGLIEVPLVSVEELLQAGEELLGSTLTRDGANSPAWSCPRPLLESPSGDVLLRSSWQMVPLGAKLKNVDSFRRALEESETLRSDLHTSCSSHQPEVFTLQFQQQRCIFLATTIAQTSLTLPDCGVVIDSGLHKTLLPPANPASTVSTPSTAPQLSTAWISRATAEQRAGRTGRTCCGVVIRVFPRWIHDSLPPTEGGVSQCPAMLRGGGNFGRGGGALLLAGCAPTTAPSLPVEQVSQRTVAQLLHLYEKCGLAYTSFPKMMRLALPGIAWPETGAAQLLEEHTRMGFAVRCVKGLPGLARERAPEEESAAPSADDDEDERHEADCDDDEPCNEIPPPALAGEDGTANDEQPPENDFQALPRSDWVRALPVDARYAPLVFCGYQLGALVDVILIVATMDATREGILRSQTAAEFFAQTHAAPHCDALTNWSVLLCCLELWRRDHSRGGGGKGSRGGKKGRGKGTDDGGTGGRDKAREDKWRKQDFFQRRSCGYKAIFNGPQLYLVVRKIEHIARNLSQHLLQQGPRDTHASGQRDALQELLQLCESGELDTDRFLHLFGGDAQSKKFPKVLGSLFASQSGSAFLLGRSAFTASQMQSGIESFLPQDRPTNAENVFCVCNAAESLPKQAKWVSNATQEKQAGALLKVERWRRDVKLESRAGFAATSWELGRPTPTLSSESADAFCGKSSNLWIDLQLAHAAAGAGNDLVKQIELIAEVLNSSPSLSQLLLLPPPSSLTEERSRSRAGLSFMSRPLDRCVGSLEQQRGPDGCDHGAVRDSGLASVGEYTSGTRSIDLRFGSNEEQDKNALQSFSRQPEAGPSSSLKVGSFQLLHARDVDFMWHSGNHSRIVGREAPYSGKKEMEVPVDSYSKAQTGKQCALGMRQLGSDSMLFEPVLFQHDEKTGEHEQSGSCWLSLSCTSSVRASADETAQEQGGWLAAVAVGVSFFKNRFTFRDAAVLAFERSAALLFLARWTSDLDAALTSGTRHAIERYTLQQAARDIWAAISGTSSEVSFSEFFPPPAATARAPTHPEHFGAAAAAANTCTDRSTVSLYVWQELQKNATSADNSTAGGCASPSATPTQPAQRIIGMRIRGQDCFFRRSYLALDDFTELNRVRESWNFLDGYPCPSSVQTKSADAARECVRAFYERVVGAAGRNENDLRKASPRDLRSGYLFQVPLLYEGADRRYKPGPLRLFDVRSLSDSAQNSHSRLCTDLFSRTTACRPVSRSPAEPEAARVWKTFVAAARSDATLLRRFADKFDVASERIRQKEERKRAQIGDRSRKRSKTRRSGEAKREASEALCDFASALRDATADAAQRGVANRGDDLAELALQSDAVLQLVLYVLKHHVLAPVPSEVSVGHESQATTTSGACVIGGSTDTSATPSKPGSSVAVLYLPPLANALGLFEGGNQSDPQGFLNDDTLEEADQNDSESDSSSDDCDSSSSEDSGSEDGNSDRNERHCRGRRPYDDRAANFWPSLYKAHQLDSFELRASLERAHRNMTKSELAVAKRSPKITAKVSRNRVVLIHAQTGTGKSTCVPLQIAYDAIIGKHQVARIAVIEPRRETCKTLYNRARHWCEAEAGAGALSEEECPFAYRIKDDIATDRHKTAPVVYMTPEYFYRCVDNSAAHRQQRGSMLPAQPQQPQAVGLPRTASASSASQQSATGAPAMPPRQSWTNQLSLRDFTHIILDEAHERDEKSDLLFSHLKAQLSRPEFARTRLVLMSATPDTDELLRFFKPLLFVRSGAVEVDEKEHDGPQRHDSGLMGASPATPAVTRRQKSGHGIIIVKGKTPHLVESLPSQTLLQDYVAWSETDVTARKKKRTKTDTATAMQQIIAGGGSSRLAHALDVYFHHFPPLLRWLLGADGPIWRERVGGGSNNTATKGTRHLSRVQQMGGKILVFLPGDAEIRQCYNALVASSPFLRRTRGLKDELQQDLNIEIRVSEIHGQLGHRNALACNELVEAGCLHILLSTNVCETGLTIQKLFCVIDTGMQKKENLHLLGRQRQLMREWAQPSQCTQRKGRLGRVCPGLYIPVYPACVGGAEEVVPRVVAVAEADKTTASSAHAIGGDDGGDGMAQCADADLLRAHAHPRQEPPADEGEIWWNEADLRSAILRAAAQRQTTLENLDELQAALERTSTSSSSSSGSASGSTAFVEGSERENGRGGESSLFLQHVVAVGRIDPVLQWRWSGWVESAERWQVDDVPGADILPPANGNITPPSFAGSVASLRDDVLAGMRRTTGGTGQVVEHLIKDLIAKNLLKTAEDVEHRDDAAAAVSLYEAAQRDARAYLRDADAVTVTDSKESSENAAPATRKDETTTITNYTAQLRKCSLVPTFFGLCVRRLGCDNLLVAELVMKSCFLDMAVDGVIVGGILEALTHTCDVDAYGVLPGKVDADFFESKPSVEAFVHAGSAKRLRSELDGRREEPRIVCSQDRLFSSEVLDVRAVVLQMLQDRSFARMPPRERRNFEFHESKRIDRVALRQVLDAIMRLGRSLLHLIGFPTEEGATAAAGTQARGAQTRVANTTATSTGGTVTPTVAVAGTGGASAVSENETLGGGARAHGAEQHAASADGTKAMKQLDNSTEMEAVLQRRLQRSVSEASVTSRGTTGTTNRNDAKSNTLALAKEKTKRQVLAISKLEPNACGLSSASGSRQNFGGYTLHDPPVLIQLMTFVFAGESGGLLIGWNGDENTSSATNEDWRGEFSEQFPPDGTVVAPFLLEEGLRPDSAALAPVQDAVVKFAHFLSETNNSRSYDKRNPPTQEQQRPICNSADGGKLKLGFVPQQALPFCHRLSFPCEVLMRLQQFATTKMDAPRGPPLLCWSGTKFRIADSRSTAKVANRSMRSCGRSADLVSWRTSLRSGVGGGLLQAAQTRWKARFDWNSPLAHIIDVDGEQVDHDGGGRADVVNRSHDVAQNVLFCVAPTLRQLAGGKLHVSGASLLPSDTAKLAGLIAAGKFGDHAEDLVVLVKEVRADCSAKNAAEPGPPGKIGDHERREQEQQVFGFVWSSDEHDVVNGHQLLVLLTLPEPVWLLRRALEYRKYDCELKNGGKQHLKESKQAMCEAFRDLGRPLKKNKKMETEDQEEDPPRGAHSNSFLRLQRLAVVMGSEKWKPKQSKTQHLHRSGTTSAEDHGHRRSCLTTTDIRAASRRDDGVDLESSAESDDECDDFCAMADRSDHWWSNRSNLQKVLSSGKVVGSRKWIDVRIRNYRYKEVVF